MDLYYNHSRLSFDHSSYSQHLRCYRNLKCSTFGLMSVHTELQKVSLEFVLFCKHIIGDQLVSRYIFLQRLICGIYAIIM
jgi:hypothetical protein